MEHLKGVAVFGDKTDKGKLIHRMPEAEGDGYYFVNNLGRHQQHLSRYIDNLVIDGITLNGYYYLLKWQTGNRARYPFT